MGSARRQRGDAGDGKVIMLAVVIVVVLGVAFLFLGGGGEGKKKHHHHSQHSHSSTQMARIPLDSLPSSAQQVVKAIKRGGPFRSSSDGQTFANKEHDLPVQPAGYYKKYSVSGGEAIVAGANGDLYYTTDGYSSFRTIKASANKPPAT